LTARTPNRISIVDLGTSAVAYNRNQRRIYFDSSGEVHHLSASPSFPMSANNLQFKELNSFEQWLPAIETHREFKQICSLIRRPTVPDLLPNTSSGPNPLHLQKMRHLLMEMEKLSWEPEEVLVLAENEVRSTSSASSTSSSKYRSLIGKMHRSNKKTSIANEYEQEVCKYTREFLEHARLFLREAENFHTDKSLNLTTAKERPRSASITSESSSGSQTMYLDAVENGYHEINSDGESDGSEEDVDTMLQKGLFKPIDMRATLEQRRKSQMVVLASRNKQGHRTVLPSPQPDCSDFSLFNLLYKNIGRDISKIRLPVKLNEPLSALQRLCEEMEYSHLLDKAANEDDPLMRMAYVAAYCVSSYNVGFYRAATKPFNPLMGETYECLHAEYGWKFVAEQISHHPPGAMAHCLADNWQLIQQLILKHKFWGKSIEAYAIGGVRVHFTLLDEEYTWNKVPSLISNLMSPPNKRTIDVYGPCVVQCNLSGVSCKLKFHKAAEGKDGMPCYVTGEVQSSKQGGRRLNLYGTWNEAFYMESTDGSRDVCLWRMNKLPSNNEEYYRFSQFAIELNELDEETEAGLQSGSVPHTDCRFRPDQRALENGELDLAEQEKFRLENTQRKTLSNLEPQPRWFSRCRDTHDIQYEFTGQYWKVKDESGFNQLGMRPLW
ncbi:hypothetical protein Ciccas_010740, partial [Cichlidogyrus casuarinus]